MGLSLKHLAKEMNVSRQTLYNFIKKNNLATMPNTKTEKTIREQYSTFGEVKKEQKKTVAKVKKVVKEIKDEKPKKKVKNNKNLTLEETSTTLNRLNNLKQEYNFNVDLIDNFQIEIETFKNENGSTTIQTHNGSQNVIPQVTQLKNYIELNLKISKQINELEILLSLEGDDEENGLFN